MRVKTIRTLNILFFVIGTIFSLYIISTIIRLFQDPSQHYTTFFLGIAILSSFLTMRDILASEAKGLKLTFQLFLFGIASLLCISVGVYLRYNAITLTMNQPFISGTDITIGWIMIISLLVLTWYHWGTILTFMIALSVAYFIFGHYVPSHILKHDQFSYAFSLSYLGMDTIGGVFWFVPLAADKIYFLIIFAALLIGIGMLPLVIELGKWMGRRVKGGAAFPAIVGSALTGSVMGQAVSNTMLTGQLTIPMMKKYGYSSNLSGAIEAVASTSGQLLPPILGLAAFIIAAFLNIAYIEVALCATLPAFLFVGGVVIGVLAAARTLNLGYLTERVDKRMIMQLFPAFTASFVAVLVLLLLYYSPNIAAIAGIAVMLIFSFIFQGDRRPGLKTLIEGFTNGLQVCTVLCLLLLAIGPIAQMATTTNLAGKLSAMLSGMVPPNLIFVLLGAMVVSLILGMGLPTPVAYLVVALTLTPFLQELGVPPLYAHMYVFYFAVFSTISPPVAISCLAAAKLSGGTFLGTARDAMKLSIPTFIIPFAFIYNPDLLSFPRVTFDGIFAFILVLLAMFWMAVALFGYLLRRLNTIERMIIGLLSIIGLVQIIDRFYYLLAIYLAAGVVIVLWIYYSRGKWPERYRVPGESVAGEFAEEVFHRHE